MFTTFWAERKKKIIALSMRNTPEYTESLKYHHKLSFNIIAGFINTNTQIGKTKPKEAF